MKSLIFVLIVVANLYFIESVNANCNPARRIFGKPSGCTDTIVEPMPSTDHESHIMPIDPSPSYEAEQRRKQEKLEMQRREQARIEQYYREQQQQELQQQERARLQEQERVRKQEAVWAQQQNGSGQGRSQQQSIMSNICQTNMNWCRIRGDYPVGTQCWCTYQYEQVYGQIVPQ